MVTVGPTTAILTMATHTMVMVVDIGVDTIMVIGMVIGMDITGTLMVVGITLNMDMVIQVIMVHVVAVVEEEQTYQEPVVEGQVEV